MTLIMYNHAVSWVCEGELSLLLKPTEMKLSQDKLRDYSLGNSIFINIQI